MHINDYIDSKEHSLTQLQYANLNSTMEIIGKNPKVLTPQTFALIMDASWANISLEIKQFKDNAIKLVKQKLNEYLGLLNVKQENDVKETPKKQESNKQ